MKMRNKGKVFPSPSSSSSSSSSSLSSHTANRDALATLKLLPAAILALVSILSSEDKEVLAYMVTRSMTTTADHSSSISEEKIKKNGKKSNTHKPPVFDCDCFDCYTSYWFRWDSSPNRELIHQAIEAFEEHLATGEQSKRNGRGKRREKTGRRGTGKPAEVPEVASPEEIPEKAEGTAGDGEEEVDEARNGAAEEEEEEVVVVVAPPPEATAAAAAVVVRSSAENNHHRGLARKVLPDVVGLLNSRLWSLWSPNV